MTFQQTIDALSFSIQTRYLRLNCCSMRNEQFVESNFKQQCKILIVIIIILFKCSKSKQFKLQRDKIKRYKLKQTRTIFRIFEKTN